MSLGWSIWVMFLVSLNMSITFFLFLWAPRAKVPVQPDQTTGHVWAHGAIREGLRRLPNWWVWFSATMFVSAWIYLMLYPGYGRHLGLLGWTSHGELARDVAANDVKLGDLQRRFRHYTPEQLAQDPAALQLGGRLFGDNCAACHGAAGKGNQLLGAPNLTDGDWLYGGSGADIMTSIHDGRGGVMPPWESLGADTVRNLVQYVLGLSGAPHDDAKAAAAAPVFASTCTACHGPEGKGNPALGAPNLTDQIWLYGGTPEDIQRTISGGRHGEMPAWDKRLNDDDIRVLAAYVYHLSHAGNVDAR